MFLELGGKSANILLDDADLARRSTAGAPSACTRGQGCAITTRMLVPRARYDEARRDAQTIFESLPYGDPAEPRADLGPVISQAQRERVLGYVETGKREGARLVTGGGSRRGCRAGSIVEPTLFADVDHRMRRSRRRRSSARARVIPYDGDDDAVRIANDSMLRPLAGRCSADRERAISVSRHRIRAGTVNVNAGNAFDAGRAVRRLQAERHRSRDGHRGVRGVPADKDRGHPA